MKLLLLLCLLGGTISITVSSFTIPIKTTSSLSNCNKYHGGSTTKTPTNLLLSSTNDNNNSNNKSNNGLKSLLPKQKRTSIPLDKYGRRIHDLKSDGMPKYSVSGSSSGDSSNDNEVDTGSEGGEDMSAPMQSDHDVTKQQQQGKFSSPSLSQYFNKDKKQQGGTNDAVLGKENTSSADLKALLPKQKMKFMKLDKFGRRIQRMEDDGTVNYSKEPTSGSSSSSSASSPPPQSSPASPIRGTREGFNSDSSKPTDESSIATLSKESSGNYGSLKKLTSSIQRPTWTKLDFKGGSVVDERRTRGINEAAGADDVITNEGGIGGGSLQDLLPKRATWTKLDFKGVSVEDTRRTRNTQQGNTESFNKGEYSSLKTLLPERTISWRKKEQLLSSGAATSGEVKRELLRREERQKAMKDDVLASVDESSGSVVASSSDEDITGSADDDEVKPYQNLKDLLPERRGGAKRIKQ